MTETVRATGGVDLWVRRWRRFWFLPESTATLGLVRIVFGALMIGWTISLLPDLVDLFGTRGLMPRPPSGQYQWRLIDEGGVEPMAVWAILLASSVALMAGWHCRLAALLVLAGVMSFERANPYALNSGDALLRLEAVFLVLAPSGVAYSFDRRRIGGSFWSAQVRAPWALRLMQVQLSMVYAFSVLNKLSGVTWRDGTAVSYALRLSDFSNFTVPEWITMNARLMNAVTWSVLLLELGIGVLVWHRRIRPWVLGVGVVLHAMVMALFAIAFFTFAVYVLYVAFTPPSTAQRIVDGLRRRARSTGPWRTQRSPAPSSAA